MVAVTVFSSCVMMNSSGNKMVEKQGRNRVYLIVLGLVAATAIFLWQDGGRIPGAALFKWKKAEHHAPLEQPKPVIAIAPLQVEPEPASPPAQSPPPPVSDVVTLLNDKGVELVLQKQFWPAIFLFKQAMELDRKRIEPVVNMAVTLDEIGLSRPSARYRAMAETMNPEYAPLPRNRKGREGAQGVGPAQKTGRLDDSIH
jgi:hypothetical protein